MPGEIETCPEALEQDLANGIRASPLVEHARPSGVQNVVAPVRDADASEATIVRERMRASVSTAPWSRANCCTYWRARKFGAGAAAALFSCGTPRV